MKNTKVLEMIKSGKLEELCSLLEQEILVEENNLTGKKKSNQTFVANHFRKDKRLGLSPALRYCIYNNDYQYFTDAYVLFMLDKDNYNVLMPELPKGEKMVFPNLDNVLNGEKFSYHKKYSTATKNLMNVIGLAKSKKVCWVEFVELKNENEQETLAYVDVKVIELAIRGLNYDKDFIDFEIDKRTGGCSLKPIRIKKGDSLALVMPGVKRDSELSEKIYLV